VLHLPGIAVDARKENRVYLFIIDKKHERVVAVEFGGIGLPAGSADQEDGGRCRSAAHFVHFDLGQMLGVIDDKGNGIGSQVSKGGVSREHCVHSH